MKLDNFYHLVNSNFIVIYEESQRMNRFNITIKLNNHCQNTLIDKNTEKFISVIPKQTFNFFVLVDIYIVICNITKL